jgi:hypothetical protein
VRKGKALEERTGAAKASVPNKKKKEIYDERRSAVFLSGVSLMRVGAGKPGAFIHRNDVSQSHLFL